MEVYYGFAIFIFLTLVVCVQVWIEYRRARRRFLLCAGIALGCAAGWHALNALSVYYELPLSLLIASGVVGLVISLLWLEAACAMLSERLGVAVHAGALIAYVGLVALAASQQPPSAAVWAATNVPGVIIVLETSRRCFRGAPSGVGWFLGLLFLAHAAALVMFSLQILVDGPYGALFYWFMALLIPIQGSAFSHASVKMQSDVLTATMAKVKQREAEYAQLIRNLPDIVLRVDADGRLLYASEQLTRAANRPINDLVGTPVCEAAFPEQATAAWQHTLAAARRTHSPQQFEFSLEGPDGSPHDYRGRALPEFEDNTLNSVLVIVEDVTESKRFVDALRDSERRFREIFESLQDVYYKTTLDGEIIEISPSVTQWGYVREDLLGRNALAVYAEPADRDKMIGKLRAQRSVRNELLRLKGGNGEIVEARWSATILGCGEGETPRIVGTLRDVSDEMRLERERARLERQFLQAQKLESVGLLAGGVAHDFNNLLQGIIGHADLLTEQYGKDEKSARRLAVILEAAQDAAALCRQLLDYSGRGHFVLAPVSLSDIVRDVTDLMEVSISKSVELRIDTTGNLPRIEGDSSQLRQMVMNLVKNAADAIGATPGHVTVSTGVRYFDADELANCSAADSLEPREYVFLRVADTGTGISAELMPRIFDPFFSTKEDGQGLGLAAVIGIVRGHQGGILLESSPGTGSMFTVLFPPVDKPEIGAPSNGREGAAGNGRLVILADDEPMVLELAQEMLLNRQFEVGTAANGREAVALFEAHAARSPIVVLDVTMPEMSGIEACRAIRAMQPDATVLLASGYADLSDRLTPEEAATIPLLPKPYRVSDLVAAIHRLASEAPPAASEP